MQGFLFSLRKIAFSTRNFRLEFRYICKGVIMAKKQKVDFSNPKIAAVIKTMAIAEGRLSRDSIYKIGSKDILYQLKNSGYIEKSKTDKSVFVATERLKKASKC